MLFYVLNIFALMLCVAVHEYGHYLAARRLGIIPLQFAVGVGPKLLWWHSQGTEFSLRPIPIGGYVNFGVGVLEKCSSRQQIGVCAAGPLMNLALCLVLVGVYCISGGKIPSSYASMHDIQFFLYAIGGTIFAFFASVVLAVYALVDIVMHPVAGVETMSGPIGILSGTAIPEKFFGGYTAFEKFMILSWAFSLAIGSFNLIPLSFLDGGRIFHLLTARWPRFQSAWLTGTHWVLGALIVYLLFGDVWKLIR